MSMTSLYDGVGFGDSKEKDESLNPSKIAGWSDNLQFMKTQLQLKKAATKGTNNRGNKSLTSSGPGNVTLSNITGERQVVVLIDEYNPLRPNDYHHFKERAREKESTERSREKERQKDRDNDDERGRDRDRDDRRERRRRSRERDDKGRRKRDDDRFRGGKAAIAPPPSLLETTPIDPENIPKKDGAGTGGFSTGNVVASQIMAKYGWKEGQGLGREEQGLSTCLQVEKTGKRAGKIINKDIEKQKKPPTFLPPDPPLFGNQNAAPSMRMDVEEEGNGMIAESNISDLMKNPSKVVLLRNMVGPGEVDDDLQPEIEEECQTKYGDINKVIIFEIPGAREEEAVRIFVEFKRMESAIKALVDLNGRFFGGRSVSATFYNIDRFRRLDLAS